MRMHARGCTYTIRKNVEGTESARVADLGSDRGYDDDLHAISPVIVALRGNIALQRKMPRRKCRGSRCFVPVKIWSRDISSIDSAVAQERRGRSGCAGCARDSRIEDAISDGGDLRHFGDVVDADDVGAAEDAGGDCRGGCEKAFF
jgi:hypothetical protein